MNRTNATKFLRELLDKHSLQTWKLRLNTSETSRFLGMCDHDKKTIILNAHHIDTHPEPEVLDTIRHEVAHALVGPLGNNHNELWKDKAKELGCANTLPCATYSLRPDIIDAIRSGATVEVEWEEEIIRTPKYTVHRIQEKCKICGKVAKEKSRIVSDNGIIISFLECGHCEFKTSTTISPFELLTFDGDPNCKHLTWKKTVCVECGAKKLYPYQIEGAQALEKANGRLAIFDEMGLGKTIQALAYLKFNPDAFPYIWVTKSGIKYQHAKEIIRILGPAYFPQILRTGREKLIEGMKGYLIGYDLFRRLDLGMFEGFGIQTIVLDECQAIKNPDSSRTAAIRKVVKEIPRVIPLSGTPWKNRGSELFVALNMLDPRMFWSEAQFKREWVIKAENGKEGGIARPKQFREHTKHIIIRRERKEVMPELPTVNRMKLHVEVADYAKKVYNEEADKIKDIVKNAALEGTSLESAENQKKINASLMVMRQIVGIAKVEGTVEYLKEFLEETEKKIICFVHHVKCGDMIELQVNNYLNDELEDKFPVLRATGGMSPEDRFTIQETFNKGKHRVLVASQLASGEGLNLQEDCYDIIMHERQWNPANEEQCESRVARIGGVEGIDQINAMYILGDKTCDTIFDSLVEFKRRHFDTSMNKDGYVYQWNEAALIAEMATKIQRI